MIFDKQKEILEFVVLDDDLTSLSNKPFGYVTLPLDSIAPFEVVTKDFTLETEEERTFRLKSEKSVEDSTTSSFSPISLVNKLVDTATAHSPLKSSAEIPKLNRSKSKTIAKLRLVYEYSPLKQTSTRQRGDDHENAGPTTDILFDLPPSVLTHQMLEQNVSLKAVHYPINSMADAALEALKLRKTQSNSSTGVLTVSGIRGKNFKIDHSFTASTLRPYLVFSVGTVKYRTAIQKDYSNPYYTESFNFIIHDPTSTVLLVKVQNSCSLFHVLIS